MKRKKIITALLIIIIGACLIYRSLQLDTKEAKRELLKRIAAVEIIDIEELTKNNFESGISKTFSKEETEEFKELLENTDDKNLEWNRIRHAKYILYLYNKEEKEIMALAVDEDYRVQSDAVYVNDEKLTSFIKEVTIGD